MTYRLVVEGLVEEEGLIDEGLIDEGLMGVAEEEEEGLVVEELMAGGEEEGGWALAWLLAKMAIGERGVAAWGAEGGG